MLKKAMKPSVLLVFASITGLLAVLAVNAATNQFTFNGTTADSTGGTVTGNLCVGKDAPAVNGLDVYGNVTMGPDGCNWFWFYSNANTSYFESYDSSGFSPMVIKGSTIDTWADEITVTGYDDVLVEGDVDVTIQADEDIFIDATDDVTITGSDVIIQLGG